MILQFQVSDVRPITPANPNRRGQNNERMRAQLTNELARRAGKHQNMKSEGAIELSFEFDWLIVCGTQVPNHKPQ